MMEDLIKALATGAAEKRKPAGDSAVLAGYDDLRAALRECLGPKVRVSESLVALEQDPRDSAVQATVADAIERALFGKPMNEKVLTLARELLKSAPRDAVDAGPHVDSPKAAAVIASPPAPVEIRVNSPSAPEGNEINRRSHPMPAPETILKAKRRFIMLILASIITVSALIFVLVRNSQNKRPPQQLPTPVYPLPEPAKSADASLPPQAEPAAPAAPLQAVTEPPAPPVEVPKAVVQAPVTPSADADAKTMSDDERARARQLLLKLDDARVLSDRGKKRPPFADDEEKLLSAVADSAGMGSEALKTLVADYLTTVLADKTANDEDLALSAYSQGRFSDASSSALKAANEMVDRDKAGAGAYYRLAGSAALEIGHAEDAVTALEKGAALTDQKLDAVAWADARLLLAAAIVRKGDIAGAQKMIALVVPVYKKALGDAHPRLAKAVALQAAILQRTGDATFVEPLLEFALHIDQKAFGPEHPIVAEDMIQRAAYLVAAKRGAEAEPLLRNALKMDEAKLGPGHPAIAVDLTALAQVLRSQGKSPEAEAPLRRALSIDEAAAGSEHPDVALRLNNLAQYLTSSNRGKEAVPLFQRALQINEKVFGPGHAVVGITATHLGESLVKTGDLKEAETAFRLALKSSEENLGKDDPIVAVRLSNLAEVLRHNGQAAEAESLYVRALQIDEKTHGPVHLSVATDLTGMAYVCENTNRLRDALPLYRRALKIAYILHDEVGKEPPELAKWENSYCTALLAQGWQPQEVTEEIQNIKVSVKRKE